MNDEEAIQKAISTLRDWQHHYSRYAPGHTFTPAEQYQIDTIPATMSVLRVALRAFEMSPNRKSNMGFDRELNLARAVIKQNLKETILEPDQAPEDDHDD